MSEDRAVRDETPEGGDTPMRDETPEGGDTPVRDDTSRADRHSRPPEPRAYTPGQMETARAASDPRESRFDGLHADAKAAIGYAANSLRTVRERYREAYLEELGRWHAVRDELERLERSDASRATLAGPADRADPAAAAEAGAEDARLRSARGETERLTVELGLLGLHDAHPQVGRELRVRRI